MSLKEYLFGFKSEDKAVKYLKNNGFAIIKRNFRSKFGEIDIIAKKSEILHFIEVKATSGEYEAVYRLTKTKFNKILKTINYFFMKNGFESDYEIDIICVEKDKIQHIKNISL